MAESVSLRPVETKDTDRPVVDLRPWLLRCSDPVAFLALCIGESNLHYGAQARRKRAYPDWSTGLCQPAMKWHGAHVPDMETAQEYGHAVAIRTEANWTRYCAWFEDVDRHLTYVLGPFEHCLERARHELGDNHPDVRLLALCWWNAPGIPSEVWLTERIFTEWPTKAPNRANYTRALNAAFGYVDGTPSPEVPPVTEQPSVPAAPNPLTLEERVALNEQQIALLVENQRRILMGDWDAARIFLDAIDPNMVGRWTNATPMLEETP